MNKDSFMDFILTLSVMFLLVIVSFWFVLVVFGVDATRETEMSTVSTTVVEYTAESTHTNKQ